MNIKRGRIFNHHDGMSELERFDMATPSPAQRFTAEDLRRLKKMFADFPDYGLASTNMREIQALLARLEAHEAMSDYLAHEDHCIRNRNSAGEPTADGGYRMMYAGKWYQSRPIDETPKCDCGLDAKWEAWRQVAGKYP